MAAPRTNAFYETVAPFLRNKVFGEARKRPKRK
jgi:hypothetical protein